MNGDTDTQRPHGYFDSERTDIADLVPPDVRTVLDVGCGTGRLGRLLKSRGVREVYGIELQCDAAERAKGVLDGVVCADVETLPLPYQESFFDCVVYADVLEHLREPLEVLRRHAVHVRPGGWLVASIPNVRFCGVVLPLVLRGEWRYQASGVLDRSHLRFFTRRSAHELIESAGYHIVESRYQIPTSRRYSYADRMTLGRLRELLAPQVLIRAQRGAG